MINKKNMLSIIFDKTLILYVLEKILILMDTEQQKITIEQLITIEHIN